MTPFVNSIRRALEAKADEAALALAMTMPDICGRIDHPGSASRERYVRWWTDNISPFFETDWSTENGIEWLTGEDAYSLRCALLHEGREDIKNQRARKALSKFLFVREMGMHMILIQDHLLLDVAEFCETICCAIAAWAENHDAAVCLPEDVIQIRTKGFEVNGVRIGS